MILKILDILRMIIVSFAFFFGYRVGFANGYDPMAEIKGFEVGSNYQRQSAIALLSYAVVAIIVYSINRPFITLLLIAGMIYPVTKAL